MAGRRDRGSRLPGRAPYREGGPVPARYRVRPANTQALMECRNKDCRAPFHPRFEVPKDGLCGDCRAAREVEVPPLPGMPTPDYGGGPRT